MNNNRKLKNEDVFPLVFRSDRLKALVIGGGEVALRKVKDLLAARVEVEGIAPVVHSKLRDIIESHSIPWHFRDAQKGDSSGYSLVILATDDPEVNRTMAMEARLSGIPVNVVDQPELCTVYFPAVVRNDPLVLAVSTGGGAPFFARETRRKLESWLEDGWSLRAQWAVIFRSFVLENVKEPVKREALFNRFMETSLEEMTDWSFDSPPVNEWKQWILQGN